MYKVLKGHQTPRGMIHNMFNQFQKDECLKLFARHNWGNINGGPAHFNFEAARVEEHSEFQVWHGYYSDIAGGCSILYDYRYGYDFYSSTENQLFITIHFPILIIWYLMVAVSITLGE